MLFLMADNRFCVEEGSYAPDIDKLGL